MEIAYELKHALNGAHEECNRISEDKERLRNEMAALQRAHEQSHEELAEIRVLNQALKERADSAEKERDRLLADQASRWDLLMERLPEKPGSG